VVAVAAVQVVAEGVLAMAVAAQLPTEFLLVEMVVQVEILLVVVVVAQLALALQVETQLAVRVAQELRHQLPDHLLRYAVGVVDKGKTLAAQGVLAVAEMVELEAMALLAQQIQVEAAAGQTLQAAQVLSSCQC
jgi:hypothetical protein